MTIAFALGGAMSRLDDTAAAEAAGHHPDIDIRWAEGGLTDRDFQLAARIQELDQPAQPA
jgi:pterin-4a-carbinolamine dehydratase